MIPTPAELSISIPTAARGAVRAYVKSLPGFEAFAAKLGVASREVKNADLIAYAASQGKFYEVKAIIDNATRTGATQPAVKQPKPVNSGDADKEYFEAMAHQNERDFAAVVEQGAVEVIGELAAIGETVVLADVLRGVDQFLSPLVKAELEKALAPVIAAANKPAVVQTVERVVEVAAPLVAPKGALPYPVKTGKALPFNKLFEVNTTHAFGKTPISLWNAHGAAPQPDPYFIVDAMNMGLLATAAETGSNVWLVGPGGSGKTSMPFYFAAVVGRPITRIGFDKQTSTEELVGGDKLVEGETPGTMVSKWVDGSLIAAMRVPGMVIFLDEPTFASAGVQAIIQQVADEHRMYTIHSTGEVVKAAPGVFFVIADNTNGNGDQTGQYAGTNPANAAMVNRFARMVKVEYLTKTQEVTALVNHTSIPKAAAEHVVEFVHQVRRLPEMEGVVMSLRQMVAFVRTVKDGFPAKNAFEVAILTRLPNEERAAVQALATMQWGEQFEQLLTGSTASTEPLSVPSNSAGAQAFDDEVSATLNR